MRYIGTEKIMCCKCGVELDVPVYENSGNKKYGYKHCHQCGASLLSADEKELLMSMRTGIAAKYGYTQEQVSAYWQGVEDAQYEYTKTMLCAAAKVVSDAVEHDKSIRND